MSSTITPKPSTTNIASSAETDAPADDKMVGPFPYGVSPNPGKDSVSVTAWGNNNPGQAKGAINNDRAHTMQIGAEYVRSKISDGQLTEMAVQMAYHMFNENRLDPKDEKAQPYWGPGGHRTEMTTVKVSLRNTASLGEGYFFKRGVNVAAVLTGPQGGEAVQRNWHQATGMGQTRGLPNQYTQGLTVGGSVGFDLSGWKRADFENGVSLEAGLGVGADVPINTGIGNARTEAQAGVGYRGFQFNVGVVGALQWLPGQAFNFPRGGGPTEGFYMSPFAEGIWRNDVFETKVRFIDNSYGTGSPMGTLVFTFYFKP